MFFANRECDRDPRSMKRDLDLQNIEDGRAAGVQAWAGLFWISGAYKATQASSRVHTRCNNHYGRLLTDLRSHFYLFQHRLRCIMEVPPQQKAARADVTTTSPKDWMYISEGGATIVFSYTGKSSAEFTGTVIRLRKAPRSNFEDPPAPVFDQDVEEPDDPSVAFQSRVSSKLVPVEHLPRLEVCHVSRPWLRELEVELSGLIAQSLMELKMVECG